MRFSRWELNQVCAGFDWDSDLDESKLAAYLDVARLDKGLPRLDILINLDVVRIENERPVTTNAGVLLFAKDSQKFLKSAPVVCALYQGNDKAHILDRKIYNDGLIDNIEQTLMYVKRHMDVRFEITSLKRKEIPQYPEEALREAIVNAVMHRDYFDASGDIMIEVFKTQIMISNPGGLVPWLNPADFGKYSRSRNSLIASMLMRTPYVEKMGTGIFRINRELSAAGLSDAEFCFDEHNFSITFSAGKRKGNNGGAEGLNEGLNEGLSEGLSEGLNEALKGLLKAIQENQGIQAKNLSAGLNRPIKTIERQIKTLTNKKLIERRGSKKAGGYWGL